MVQALVQAMIEQEEKRKSGRKLVGMLGMLAAAACILGSVGTKNEQRRLQLRSLSDSTPDCETAEDVAAAAAEQTLNVYEAYCRELGSNNEYCHRGSAMQCEPNHADNTHVHCNVKDDLDKWFGRLEDLEYTAGSTLTITCTDGTSFSDDDGPIPAAVDRSTIARFTQAMNAAKVADGGNLCESVEVTGCGNYKNAAGVTEQVCKTARNKIRKLLQRNHPNKDWMFAGNENMGYCPCRLGYCGGCGCRGNCRRLEEREERRLEDGLVEVRRQLEERRRRLKA